MCGTIIVGFLVLCVIALYIGGLLIGGDIVLGVLLLLAIGRFFRSLTLKPSVMKCRNCGSTHVKISTVVDGHDYNSTINHGFGMRFYSGKSKVRRKRVAKCWDCGFTDDYIMPEDVSNERTAALGGMFLFGVAFAALMFLTFTIFSDKPDNSDEFKTFNETGSVWSKTNAPLSDFDYYIDGTEIHLKEYEGESDEVRIPNTYNIDGVEMQVVSLDGTFALDNHAKSVIVPDGVRTMADHAFNSCDVEYLYLPASLTEFDGWSYFHDLKKIYYGGSESDWQQLCDVDRASLDVQQIICDKPMNELK